MLDIFTNYNIIFKIFKMSLTLILALDSCFDILQLRWRLLRQEWRPFVIDSQEKRWKKLCLANAVVYLVIVGLNPRLRKTLPVDFIINVCNWYAVSFFKVWRQNKN